MWTLQRWNLVATGPTPWLRVSRTKKTGAVQPSSRKSAAGEITK